MQLKDECLTESNDGVRVSQQMGRKCTRRRKGWKSNASVFQTLRSALNVLCSQR